MLCTTGRLAWCTCCAHCRLCWSAYGFCRSITRPHTAESHESTRSLSQPLSFNTSVILECLHVKNGSHGRAAIIDTSNSFIILRWPTQVRCIERVQEIPHDGPFCDLMWSDPEDIDAWAVSPRGAGWLFGGKVTAEFNSINGLDLVCRAHQLVQVGCSLLSF